MCPSDDAAAKIDQIRDSLRGRGLDPGLLRAMATDSLLASILAAPIEGSDANSKLATFLREGGFRPFRELVEHHLRRQSTGALQTAVMGEVELLPERLRSGAIGYIDSTNALFARDQRFWQNASCNLAATGFWIVAATMYADAEVTACVANPLAPTRSSLAFGLFQIPTLSFAYSASTQRSQRAFMGIRKGFFG